jgi:hypothetical protein
VGVEDRARSDRAAGIAIVGPVGGRGAMLSPTAAQAGNANYNPAANITRTFTVTP